VDILFGGTETSRQKEKALSYEDVYWQYSLRSAGSSWKLELEWCERKTLLPDWWLEASAGAM